MCFRWRRTSCRKGAARQDYVVMGLNQRRVQLTYDLSESLRDIFAMDKQNIDFTVKTTVANKVVIGLMLKGDSGEEESSAEVVEEIEPPNIIRIGVGITADEMGGIWVDGSYFFNMGFKFHKHGGKFLVLASSWEIKDSVERRNN